MRGSKLAATLGMLGLATLACGGGDKVPKPWVEREGQKKVVGNPQNVDGVASGREAPIEGPAPNLQQPQVQVIEPRLPDDLPPVADNYDELAAAGAITECPEGTTLHDERQDKGQQHCVLPDGTRHGPFLLWHTNGVVKEVGPYVGGKRHGTVTTWDRKGIKYSAYTWEDGAPVDGEVYK